MTGLWKDFRSEIKSFFRDSTNPGDNRAMHRSLQSDTPLHAQSSLDPLIASTTYARTPSSKAVDQGSLHAARGSRVLVDAVTKRLISFGPLAEAIRAFTAFVDSLEATRENRTQYASLREQLGVLLDLLDKHANTPMPPAITASIEELGRKIQEELGSVERSHSTIGIGRLWNAERSAEALADCQQRIQGFIQQFTIQVKLEELEMGHARDMDARLNMLSNSPSAPYGSFKAADLGRSGCVEGTRVDLLLKIHDWANDATLGNIYWLNGMAGTGKTTIAYSLCESLKNDRRLGASFFCSQQLPECRDVNRIVPSIVFQLSTMFPAFRSAVSAVLKEDPEVHHQSIREQFKQLLMTPVISAKHEIPIGLVAVIDALDECDGEQNLSEILETLLLYAPGLPIKFFITSRPDAAILDKMRSQQAERVKTELRLHELAQPTVQSDIRTYLTLKLEPLSVSKDNMETLVQRSGVLFIYAATVVRYISSKNFARGAERLEDVIDVSAGLSEASTKDIDALYTAILKTALSDEDLSDLEKTKMLLVLHTAVCAREPLSVDVLAGLLRGVSGGSVHAALLPLLSVLQVSDSSNVVTILHESFPNYLFSKQRSGNFYCDKQEHNTRLAQLCFDQINIPKPFNICELESSYFMDRDIPGLDTKVEKAISNELFYACRYWGAHVRLGNKRKEIANSLHGFLSERLLVWMEVMNLKGCIDDATRTMYEVEAWSRSAEGVDNLRSMVRDGLMFVRGYATSAARHSTIHIYMSALRFWPASSIVRKYYQQKTPQLINQKSTAIELRRIAPVAIINTPDLVTCVAHSPDGKRLVSSSLYEATIWMWDAVTGQPVGQPLEGHADSVTSIAYSPDGQYFVSGSRDFTIRVWDAVTGRPVGRPLEGHTGAVNSVAYSPHGQRLASGSDDNTIRVWDTVTGQPVGQPLEGHTETVESVAYSPDGQRLASSSGDGSIRMWDTVTSRPVGQPLQADDIWPVESIAYSPDGRHLVSGSGNCTIQVWDAVTGRPVGQRLEGHTNPVTSIAYSPDGKHFVSGSRDSTVRIWDAVTGQPVGQPLQGHTWPVLSVAYSPDGEHIISGSSDCTIRIWDALTSQPTSQSLEGHTNSVNSVVYSPDGQRIVSISRDSTTIRIWDMVTGQPDGQPLQGHTWPVTSIAYSPDGERIASGCYRGIIWIWDAVTGQPVGQPLEGHTSPVRSIAYSPDAKRFVSSSMYEKTIRVWDAVRGQPAGQPLEGHTETVNSVVYSPDGRHFASGSDDNTIRVWDAVTGQPVGRPLEGHTGAVNSVAYSPDGRRLASGSNDNTIRMWDMVTGQPIVQPLDGHIWPVESVTYSSDGQHLVSASQDHTIRIWDAVTGQPAGQPLEGHTESVNSVAYSPDGRYLVSGSRDHTIRIWDFQPHGLIAQSLLQTADKKSSLANELGTVLCPESPESHICNSACQLGGLHRAWTLNKDGWVVVDGSKLLVWVPPDLWTTVVSPQNTGIVGSQLGSLYLDFNSHPMGDHWAEHYKPVMLTGSQLEE